MILWLVNKRRILVVKDLIRQSNHSRKTGKQKRVLCITIVKILYHELWCLHDEILEKFQC